MKTELQKSERSQKKKSSRPSSERGKMILPQSTPSNASLVPLPSSDDDEYESPSKVFLENYSQKTTVHSNVSVENLITGTQEGSSTISLKSPLNAPLKKSARKKTRITLSKQVSSAIKQEKMPQNLNNLHQMSSSEESSSPSKKGHECNSSSKKGHERSSPGKKCHERSSSGKKGNDHNSSSKKIHESSSPGKKGHESSSPGKKGHESSSPGKKGHESSSPGKKGHESSSPSKKGHESNSPGKKGHESSSPMKKVRSVKKMAPVDNNMTHVDCQSETPTLPLQWQPVEMDQLPQCGHQADTGEHSDDSSESSSLADSSSEDGRPTPTKEEQHVSESDLRVREDEEEDGAKTPKQMSACRFKAPEHYTECSMQNKELNKEDTADCDLWLIKVPYDFDMADMKIKDVTVGGVLMVKTTTEKDGEDRVWQMEASQDDTLEASSWCVMLPSKTDNRLSAVGPLKGQFSLTRSIQSLPYALPSVPRKHVDMPKGLTMRNIPFGADTPLYRKSKRNKDRQGWHGDISVKKQKRKRHLEETESIADVMKEEPADWTTMKHHKKHKTHKRHSIKVER